MTSQRALQAGKREATARRRREGARRVRAFRRWLASCDPSGPIVRDLRRKPPTPTKADYAAYRELARR